MTFADELKQVATKVDLKHKVDRQLEELQTKIMSAANNGYHSFAIDIFSVQHNIYMPARMEAENRYKIFTGNSEFYKCKIIDFLHTLGFDSSNITSFNHYASYYESTHFVVEW